MSRIPARGMATGTLCGALILSGAFGVNLAQAQSTPAARADRAALQGTWSLVSATNSGQAAPAGKPKTIDYHVLGGLSPAGATQLGIYQLQGDTALFCFAPPGRPRPSEFASHDGDRHTCSVWHRAKP